MKCLSRKKHSCLFFRSIGGDEKMFYMSDLLLDESRLTIAIHNPLIGNFKGEKNLIKKLKQKKFIFCSNTQIFFLQNFSGKFNNHP
jgi:hypothetical protein